MRFPALWLFIFFTWVPTVVSNIHVNAQDEPPTPVEWALAVHGGAGGDASGWSDEQREARRAGITAAIERGSEILRGGGSALDAVEAVVRVLEDDPAFNAGRGSVRTSEGTFELDASIMDGRDRACGAVAGVTVARNPIQLARRVMSETRHVLLIGPGADAFAQAQQVPLVDPDYFSLRTDRGESESSLYQTRQGSTLGTVGCVALDRDGNLAAATSTGGVRGKMVGRVGDSPIVGAGTFADNRTCAVSATGVGEEFIRNAIAYDISAQMLYQQRSLSDAVEQAIFHTLAADTGGLIAVGADGTIVMRHNTPGMTCGAADSRGTMRVMLAVPQDG